MGLWCLALLLIPMKTKKMDEDIPYILKVVPITCMCANSNILSLSHTHTHIYTLGNLRSQSFLILMGDRVVCGPLVFILPYTSHCNISLSCSMALYVACLHVFDV